MADTLLLVHPVLQETVLQALEKRNNFSAIICWLSTEVIYDTKCVESMIVLCTLPLCFFHKVSRRFCTPSPFSLRSASDREAMGKEMDCTSA
jgi:hypothetical protein